VNLQFSESFTNDAATAAGRFHSDARVATGTSANSTSLTIVYEAATRSYTISTAGRSQSFKPTDIDPVQTGSGITVFKKTSGSLTESLSLTDPGISGPLSYDYVGSGFWQRAKKNSASVDFTFDAFTYGVETVDASLPRTGVGLYSVELIGARAFGAPLAMAGQGTLQVNFLDGDISSRGQLATISLETNDVLSTGNYLATANLSSNGNSFAGTFTLDDFNIFTGGWQGRFYGPAAQEVGATWYLTASDGQVTTGTLMGRVDPSIQGRNTSLLNLQFDQTFNAYYSEIFYRLDADNNVETSDRPSRSGASLSYDADSGDLTYSSSDGINQVFTPDDRIAAESNTSVSVYGITASDGTPYKLMLFNPGSSNTEFALTYSSFGLWQRPSGPGFSTRERYFTWGFPTESLLVPRTGTARFDGIIKGTAVSLEPGGPAYALSGTSRFDVNFAAAGFTGSLTPVGTELGSGVVRNFGTFRQILSTQVIDGLVTSMATFMVHKPQNLVDHSGFNQNHFRQVTHRLLMLSTLMA
jgi:hypothetical protein